MSTSWQPEDVDDLASAIREFEAKLPGWWWSIGSCSVSRDATCGVDRTGPDGDLVREPLFGDALSYDDPNGSTADALRRVMADAIHARDTRRATGQSLPPDFVETAARASGNRSLNPLDRAAREMVAAVRSIVGQVMVDILRMGMQRPEAEADRYARACLEEMPARRIPALVAAHDKLGAALNSTAPEAPPILSLTTERPA